MKFYSVLLMCPVLLDTLRVSNHQNFSNGADHQNDDFEAESMVESGHPRRHDSRSRAKRRHRPEPCYAELSGLARDEGREVASAHGVSAKECKQKCSRNSECQSVSYSPGLKGCWLKDRSFSGGEDSRVIQDFKTYYKLTCSGNHGEHRRRKNPRPQEHCYDELSGLALDEGRAVGSAAGVSAGECKKKCDENGECQSITYCPGFKGCYLKDREQNAGAELQSLFPRPCLTYFKVRHTHVNKKETCYDELSGFAVDEGGNVGAAPGVSAEECKQKCSDTTECHSISYSSSFQGCWLKDRSFSGGEEAQVNGDFKTYYKAPCNGCNGGRRRRTTPKPQGLWQSSGETEGPEEWCRAEVPAQEFQLRSACGGNMAEVKVLSFNLKWWDVFGNRGGEGVGQLIKDQGPYDIMGFQECNDVQWVLRLAGLTHDHAAIQKDFAGRNPIAIAYKSNTWELIDSGTETVAEDNQGHQYYGYRGVVWARLRHRIAGKTVFAMNHHGPLFVDFGGMCGGKATAYNLLKVIGVRAQDSDLKILLGDFNAQGPSETQKVLKKYMHNVTSNWVDAIFATCVSTSSRVLGTGGSDHPAIEASFRI